MNTRALGWILCAATACIIPDRHITFEGGPDNAFAVRILERTALPPEMETICNADENEMPGVADVTFCPPVRRSLPSGLVQAADGGPFCICAGDGNDLRAIDVFSIYAEDGDLVGDSARDRLYGVFVLDPDPFVDEVEVEGAFYKYWEFGREGRQIEEEDLDNPVYGRTAPGQARDPAPQWEFRIDNGSGVVDLCNTEELEPGLHNLQFIVTDRPFFAAPWSDEEDGSAAQPGVPDLAAGASYAVVNYVFECVDALADDEDPRARMCQCD